MKPWVLVGLAGQACFFRRFFIQWLASERRRQSVVPVAFIVGQATGLLVYSRNLYFIGRQQPG